MMNGPKSTCNLNIICLLSLHLLMFIFNNFFCVKGSDLKSFIYAITNQFENTEKKCSKKFNFAIKKMDFL